MSRYVLDFHEIDRTQVALAGGKGAHLGELYRIDGIHVPAGFCITTAAFERILRDAPAIGGLIDELSRLAPDDRTAIRERSAQVRAAIEAAAIPHDLATAIVWRIVSLGAEAAYAVRSSATAEDAPSASFAGLQDTFLNVIGPVEILRHVGRCWASLFTERAVSYRLRQGIDARHGGMAVVVQRMVFPRAAGVVFTADPVSGNRKVASVEACFGLGEALVSGRVNADVYKVRDGAIVASALAAKTLALDASPDGGTQERAIDTAQQAQPALTHAQVLELVRQARRIEAHFGSPQDIEWCLADGDFHIVQSRPITTLFPLLAPDDGENHVYLSTGHQQMMTGPLRPLGISVKQLLARPRMLTAGGRLYVEVTRALASPGSRAGLLSMMEKSDPLTKDALDTLLARGFVPQQPAPAAAAAPAAALAPIPNDPAIVDALMTETRDSLDVLSREIRTKSGLALVDFVLADFTEFKRLLFDPVSHQAIMAGIEASWWLNEKLHEWLGEKNAADVLTLSAPGNITSEMGLALMDVADVVRPHPAAVEFLRRMTGDDTLDGLAGVAGGRESRDAIQAWLDKYGMRGAAEMDLTSARWIERPAALVPVLLGHVANAAPGAAAVRFEQGRRASLRKEREVLRRLRELPDGERKAEETRWQIERLRLFIGYREYPKYGMVNRYFIYRQALLGEAGRLVHAGVLRERDDIYYLTLPELRDVVQAQAADAALIARRREQFEAYHALTPPRVLTSEGEGLNGSWHRGDVPAGALVGLAVSGGVVEGRARLVTDLEQADVGPEDILVTTCTDPGWTPLFAAIKGLVTEVGGLMTHGAVIAREYGLPAVVSVENATRRIRDGQRIRVNGTDGIVEILD